MNLSPANNSPLVGQSITRPSSVFVNGDRLWQHHCDIAAIGATGRGGVNRQALTQKDAEARSLLLSWATKRGFSASIDPIGNLFIRRKGVLIDAPAVLAGSHLDTQPTGGNFDGVFGVLAAFEVLESLEDREIVTNHPLELVVWTNEEGSRFPPATMGSAVFAGRLSLDSALSISDLDGITVRSALAETLKLMPPLPHRSMSVPPFAYIEAHIEQGPLLDSSNADIGVVTGIQGMRQFLLTVHGFEGHAGTTPRSLRKDALVAARRIIDKMEQAFSDPADIVRFTVGRLEVLPGSPNVIPGRVNFTIDLRHPDRLVLEQFGEMVSRIAESNVAPCSVEIREPLNSVPISFDTTIVDIVRATAGRLGYTHLDIVSGATHDARHMASVCPSGMIFVPCREGLSHNEAESAEPDELTAGAEVLRAVMIEISAN